MVTSGGASTVISEAYILVLFQLISRTSADDSSFMISNDKMRTSNISAILETSSASPDLWTLPDPGSYLRSLGERNDWLSSRLVSKTSLVQQHSLGAPRQISKTNLRLDRRLWLFRLPEILCQSADPKKYADLRPQADRSEVPVNSSRWWALTT